jgi:hypothetical protein
VNLRDIVFETGRYWVKRAAKNTYEVYENGSVCAERRASYSVNLGPEENSGLDRAIAHAKRLADEKP